MKKVLSLMLAFAFVVLVFAGCNSAKNEKEFYALVSEAQECLDRYADDILFCWYDYERGREYSSIDHALLAAKEMNFENRVAIESKTERIMELYEKVKDGEMSEEVKNVIQVYIRYYECVMEASGTLSSFSDDVEIYGKKLSVALRDLRIEL